MEVKRSIKIEAPIKKIKETLLNFRTWPDWSPWLIAEPEAKITYADDGKSYSWEGKRLGAGEMSIKDDAGNQIEYDLLFLKPWKSTSTTDFLIKDRDTYTEVIWTMKTKWPFYLFFMKKKTEAFIGNDYERGLAMLKEYIETGKVNSKIDILGVNAYEGTKYIGISRDTSIEGMKQHMGSDFGTLMHSIEGNGQWFSIYHKFDFVNDKVSYTACVGVDNIPDILPDGAKADSLPSGKIHTVRHTGPYDHIGNAWATSMMMIRNKEFKPKKKYHPIEFYKNSPENTPPNELVSEISFIV